MKKIIHNLIVCTLIVVLTTFCPTFLTAQQKLMGELTINGNASGGFVTLNGERVVNGRSISSPSAISTAPQTSARIFLAKTGTISIAPDSKLNLSFISSSLSVDISAGEITVQAMPNTSLNLFTPDGNLTLPIENQENIVKIEIVNGKTIVRTLAGQAGFNNVIISAGEYYPLDAPNNAGENNQTATDNSAKSKGLSPYLLVGLLGGAAAIALVVLAGSSNNGNNTPVVSPTR